MRKEMIPGKTPRSLFEWMGSLYARMKRIVRLPVLNDSGKWGEAVAEKYLRRKKYRILGRRVRTAHREEIDLVAFAGDTLVFVEVKTRASEAFGRPFDAVNRTKRLQLTRAAAHYVKRQRPPPPYVRFDVVEVIGRPGSPPRTIRHLENAFPPEAGYRFP